MKFLVPTIEVLEAVRQELEAVGERPGMFGTNAVNGCVVLACIHSWAIDWQKSQMSYLAYTWHDP